MGLICGDYGGVLKYFGGLYKTLCLVLYAECFGSVSPILFALITGDGVGVEKIYADSNTDSVLVNFIKIGVCFILFLFQWNEFHFILIFHYFFFFLSEFIYLFEIKI